MEHNTVRLFLVIAALVSSLSQIGIAQIGLQQQMPNYQPGTASGAAIDRNRAEAPSAISNSELKVVPADFAKLKLAPGFLVGVNVLDDPDFVGSFRIDEQGNITVPILGALHIAGQTANEARDQIEKRLIDERILNDPQVTVTTLEYSVSEVTIIGEVTSPGRYPLLVSHKLVDVLALAGGPTLIAGNGVRIVREGAANEPIVVRYSRTANPKAIEDVMVNPGDTVQVERAGIVYVLGAVNRPGGYVMQEDGTLSVLQAISLASGTSISASTGKIYILRRTEEGTHVDIEIRYKEMARGKYSDLQLQSTDIVYVPTSTMKSILTNSQGILASAASASIYAAAIH